MLNPAAQLYQSVYSDGNLTEAWHKVKTKSSSAAGTDGVSLSQFERYLFKELKSLQADLARQRYRPQPARLTYIHDKSKGERSIAILTVRDRIAQRAVLNVLEPLFEGGFDDCSYGFRPGRSVAMAVEQVAHLVNEGHTWAVKADIAQCFESINVCRLQRLVGRRVRSRRLCKLVHCWLTLDLIHGKRATLLHEPKARGLLQGSPLSPLLANVYLDQFDKQARRKRLSIVRYADDICILCQTHAEAKRALRQARRILASLDLTLNPRKTHILHVEEGLSFLGATLEFQESEDGNSLWSPAFPETVQGPEVDEPIGIPLVSEELEPLLKEASKHTNGHPIRR